MFDFDVRDKGNGLPPRRPVTGEWDAVRREPALEAEEQTAEEPAVGECDASAYEGVWDWEDEDVEERSIVGD